jgi:hypothetical protein
VDGVGGLVERREADRLEFVRQARLVDDPDGLAVGFGPDSAPVFAVNVHG